ncbi:MAG: indolepyruvate ferredoxin oxidoreductase subunit alpha, partial [Parasporobacterium sp.]|nr:indolepyruvate ferredoxin oxidoreductase subunit alpha [Parasporobacterium sp.]
VKDALVGGEAPFTYTAETEVPARPPVLCAGCPHRGFYYALSRKMDKFVSFGDIGCYSLGVNAPLNGFDALTCMGAGISSLIGLAKALELQGDTRKAIGQLGDSTFFHSGVTSLIDVVSNKANVIACILDNSITAMTGHQENPGTAKNLMGEESPVIDMVALVKAIGIDDAHLRVVDPIDQEAVNEALEAGFAAEGPFVIITKRPCALIKEVARANAGKYIKIDPDKCKGCKACMKIACPSLSFDPVTKKASVADTANCNGCGLCLQMCKFDAMERKGE